MTLPSERHASAWEKGRQLDPAVWRRLGARQHFVEMAQNGVDLGLHSLPAPFHGKNYASVNEFLPEVSAEIARLEALGKIEKVMHKPYIVHSLGAVAKKGTSKVRVIMDCTKSGLNAHLSTPPMGLPTVRHATRLLKRGYWMGKLDLSDGFLHIPLRDDQCDLIGFQHPATGEFYRYRYLCFGLACAPFIFQSTMQEVMRLASLSGVSTGLAYIDDIFVGDRSKKGCAAQMQAFSSLAADLGWRVNAAKTEGPTQCIEYLGLGIDTLKMRVFVPECKISKTIAKIDELLSLASGSIDNTVPSRQLASVVGSLTHISLVSPGAGARLRAGWQAAAAASLGCRWDPSVPWSLHNTSLSQMVLDDLRWWIEHLNGKPTRRLWEMRDGVLDIWHPDWVPAPDKCPDFCQVVTTDAAGAGWGATFNDINRWAGTWSDLQGACSSNWRELKGVYLALLHWAGKLTGKRVVVRVDNSCAVAYTNRKHGRADRLCSIAQDIHRLEKQYKFEAVAIHIPGKDNHVADGLSRLSQSLYSTRTLLPSVCSHLSTRLGQQPIVARMSVPPEADTLRQDGGARVLWCPGPHEYVAAVHAAARTNGVLLVPDVRHAGWWSMVQNWQVLQRWDAGTRLFSEDQRLPVPDSHAPALVVRACTSAPWVALLPSRTAKRKRSS